MAPIVSERIGPVNQLGRRVSAESKENFKAGWTPIAESASTTLAREVRSLAWTSQALIDEHSIVVADCQTKGEPRLAARIADVGSSGVE
jgi:hypothetical protein